MELMLLKYYRPHGKKQRYQGNLFPNGTRCYSIDLARVAPKMLHRQLSSAFQEIHGQHLEFKALSN